jgi:hypothetical protein
MRKYLALFAVAPIAAQAAIPAAVTTALTDAAVDAAALWALLIAAALVGVGFKLGIFGLKKAPSVIK